MEEYAMINKNFVISVGIGYGQLEFIKRLKAHGYKVIGFGKGKNSEEAVSLCDYTAEIDTRDFEGASAWIDSLAVRITAVGSFAGGGAIDVVQRLTNYYHTHTAIPESLIVGSDKIQQQRMYSKYNLSKIKTWRAKNLSIQELSAECSDKMFIVKPSAGRGSEGVEIVSKQELSDMLDKRMIASESVIQVLQRGREYRCMLIVQDRQIKLLAPILRESYRGTFFLGRLRYEEKDLSRLRNFFGRFVKSSGIISTIIKADVIVSDSRIDVIEMDIGVGGGSYYKKFISRIYGRDIIEEYISLITNQNVDSFYVMSPFLRMDYVFNRLRVPVHYDLEECRRVFEQRLGKCELQINVLHPERKADFSSNADFIFTVMYESADGSDAFTADDIANELLFKCGVKS